MFSWKKDRSVNGKERYYMASQWRLMWWKFKKHKVALGGGAVLICLYTVAIFCEFVSPYNSYRNFGKYINAPIQRIRFFDDGEFHLRPFVYGLKCTIDSRSRYRTYTINKYEKYPIYFFIRGDEYKLWNLFKTDLHLFGVKEDDPMFLFGTDKLGRDLFSRTIYATRISLSIGLIGVFLSFSLGILLGGIAGYFGGVLDNVIMRVVDVLVSIPTLPLWMALAAAVPMTWSSLQVYFIILLILSFFGWCSLARIVRGKFLSLRQEDFVLAATLIGSKRNRVIFRHMLPSFLSHIIVSLTLAVPSMILAETALSFLGLGLRPPVVSWGVLLHVAQNVRTLDMYPWRLIPALFVIVSVLAFNFMGDGLRDAADPYR